MIFTILSEGGIALAKNALRYAAGKGIPVYGPPSWELAAAELQAVGELRPELKNPYIHWTIALEPRDRDLTDEQLASLALEGLKELGYENCPVAISRHHDEPHAHLHGVVSRVTYDGVRVNRDKEMYRAMAWCRKVELREGLYRVQDERRGLPVLPPLGVQALPELPEPGSIKTGKLALEHVLRPGLTVRELVAGLVEQGHQVRPAISLDGTTLKSLSIQVNGVGEFMPLSVFGDYSIAKLIKKRGLAKVKSEDIQVLAPMGHVPVRPPSAARIGKHNPRVSPKVSPLLVQAPMRLCPAPPSLVPKPPRAALAPTPLKQEIGYVLVKLREAQLWLPPSYARDLHLRPWNSDWATPAAGTAGEHEQPSAGKHRLG